MADPIGVAASVLALLQLAASATQYLKDVKGGAAERTRLRDELRGVTCVLQMLQDRVDDAVEEDGQGGDEQSALEPRAVASLVGPDGLLAQFRAALEDIIARLAPKAGRGAVKLVVKWPFEKKEVAELLGRMERLKTMFVLVLQNDLVSLAEKANEKLDSLGEQVRGLELSSRNEEMEMVLSWISATSFRPKHAEVLQSVQAGTGEWLLQDETFLKWVSGEVDFLWCPGIPGAGKTRLASLVIDHLEKQGKADSRATLAYIYCDYNKRETQTSQLLVSSLLEQVLRRNSTLILSPEVESLCSQHIQRNTRPTLKELSEALAKICSSFETVHVVVDALDECSLSDEAALEFIATIRSLGANFRLFCTSRYSSMFDAFFSGSPRIEVVAHDQDVRLFLETQLKNPSRLRQHIQADPILQEDVVKTIVEGSRGMFLLAALHLESLSKCHTRKKVRSSLQTLPKTLDATYEQAMARIRSQSEEDVDLAEAVIFWVLCSQRPLHVVELQHMYAVRIQMRDDDVPFTLEDDDLPPSELITSVCGGLVTTSKVTYEDDPWIVVQGATDLVLLVHYTAQEHLLRVHQDRMYPTQLEMTRICLNYLQLNNFSSGPVTASENGLLERIGAHIFLDYAAGYWAAAIDDEKLDDIWEDIEKFLNNQTAVKVAGQATGMYWVGFGYDPMDDPRGLPPLVYAAAFGAPCVLRRLVREGNDIEVKGLKGDSPLLASVFRRDGANTTALLEMGADVEALNDGKHSPLSFAMMHRSFIVFKALIDGGADVNRRLDDKTYITEAAREDLVDLVRMLVEAGADVLAADWSGESALSKSHSEELVNYLLDMRAAVPTRTMSWYALYTARDWPAVTRRLMAHYDAVVATGLQQQASAAGDTLACVFNLNNSASEVATEATNEGYAGLELVLGQFASTRDFHGKYDIQDELHQCHNGKTHCCTNKITNVSYAVKIVKFSDISAREDVAIDLLAEIRCLDEARHENIVGIVDTIASNTSDELFLVLESTNHGDLLGHIKDNGPLSTPSTRVVFRQLFSALVSLHENGWIHRDIKTENILIRPDLTIQLTGFGLATKLTDLPDEQATRLCGTPNYMAPEMLVENAHRRYSYPVDMWSAGVVLYICLCGFPPFSSELKSPNFSFTLAEQIKGEIFAYPFPQWRNIASATLAFVEKLLEKEPGKRPTAKHGLDDYWTRWPVEIKFDFDPDHDSTSYYEDPPMGKVPRED